jgi:hypothetical protein
MSITKIDGGNACCLGESKEFQDRSKMSDDMIDRMIESYLDRWDPYDYGR